jgi:heme/copper-type cytochrome/quinol oxidase subunit 3
MDLEDGRMTAPATPWTGTVSVAAPPAARASGRGVGFWGMAMMIATEAVIFVGLLSTYFFLRASSSAWPQDGIAPPKLFWIGIFSIVLVSSSIPVLWAETGIARGRQTRLRVGLAAGFVLGAAFVGHEIYEWSNLDFSLTSNAYASIFYVTTGLHLAHVIAGLLMSAVVQLKAWRGKLSADRHVSMQVFSMYWHFVDGVWVFVFAALYLSEHVR